MPSNYQKIQFIALILLVLLMTVKTGEIPHNNIGVLNGVSPTLAAEPLNAAQLVKKGIEQYQAGQIQAAIAFWKQA